MLPALRVLSVDDLSEMRGLMGLQLKAFGCVVVDVPNARAALDLLSWDSEFDVIFTDFAMPGMNGVEFIQRVKAHYETIPVVLMTAIGWTEVLTQALQQGAIASLQRPYGKNELQAVLNNVPLHRPLSLS
jgi:CheY-like chemotaxis protein